MHLGNITRLIKKQLKYQYPNWKWLKKKSKKKNTSGNGKICCKVYSDQLFNLYTKRPTWPEITNKELRFIDKLLYNNIVNKLIAPINYTPTHRDFHPYQLFRMELLKIIKYPEITTENIAAKSILGLKEKRTESLCQSRYLVIDLLANQIPFVSPTLEITC